MEKKETRGRKYKTGTERDQNIAFRTSKTERKMLKETLSLLKKNEGKAISYTDMFVMLAQEKLNQLQNQQL